MVFNLKDIIYIIGWAGSVIGIFLAFRNELNNLKKDQKKVLCIIWQNGGRLNLVDHKTCREYRDVIWSSMRKCDTVMEGMNTRLDSMNENIIRILVKLELNGKEKIN
jgi:hypothetical protein